MSPSRILVPSALVGALLLSACGGSSAPAAAPAPNAPAATITPPPAATTAPQAATSAPAATANWSALMGAAKNASYKVVYKLTMAGAGQNMSGEQTVYAKPPKSRMDMVMAPMGAISMYTDGSDNAVMCMSLTGTRTCNKMSMSQAGAQAPGGGSTEDVTRRPDDFNATPAGNRTVAGQSASCFNVAPKQPRSGFDSALMCATAQGVLVYSEIKSQQGAVTLEATSVNVGANAVSDADVTPPAATDASGMPGLPGGIQLPAGVPTPPGGIPNIPGGIPQIPGGVPSLPGR